MNAASSDPHEDPSELPPKYCEERLAAEFTRRNGPEWRYIDAWSRWYLWDGRRWLAEETLRAFDIAREVARDISTEARHDMNLEPNQRQRVASSIATAKTIAAIERLARADRVHAMTNEQWDVDPWLLNTPDGIVYLRSGKTGPHVPDAYMTRITAARTSGMCPSWHAFLARVTGDDRELQAFLQRFVGYCLTGSTQEHALLFLYGLGGNGKSTFISAILGAFGDYATTAPMETFVESYTDRHPTDLAMLRGARLVVAQEVEDGQRWAASRIKQLTGGDMVRARFMRQDFFEYTPQFKLLLSGNHKPAFRHVDEAIRRRFLLVPFTQTITAEERDKVLLEKLKAERAGILAWAIAGCLEWQRTGLAPPPSVVGATAAYLEDEDLMRTWLTECCESDHSAFCPVAELHASYQAWAMRAGEKYLGLKRFSQAFEDHGYTRDRSTGNRVRGFRGVCLRQQQGRLNSE